MRRMPRAQVFKLFSLSPFFFLRSVALPLLLSLSLSLSLLTAADGFHPLPRLLSLFSIVEECERREKVEARGVSSSLVSQILNSSLASDIVQRLTH